MERRASPCPILRRAPGLRHDTQSRLFGEASRLITLPALVSAPVAALVKKGGDQSPSGKEEDGLLQARVFEAGVLSRSSLAAKGPAPDQG